MNSSTIGNLGELKVIEACLRQNIPVFIPFGDGNIVDMVLIVNGKCIKAQVKSTNTDADGVMSFTLRSPHSTHQQNPAHYYSDDEIDIFLLYSFVYNEVYVMPINNAPTNTLHLRHDNPKRKLKTMHFAKDYLFENKIWEIAKNIK